MNATQLADKIDTALFLAGFKMRVSWHRRYYLLHYGHFEGCTPVYAAATWFYPRRDRYSTVWGRRSVTDEYYPGGIREFVLAIASAHADTEPGVDPITAYSKLKVLMP